MKFATLSVALVTFYIVATGHVVPTKKIEASVSARRLNEDRVRKPEKFDPIEFDPWVEPDPWNDIVFASGNTNAPGQRGKKTRKGKGKTKSSSRIAARIDPWTTDPWTGPDILMAGGTTNAPGKKKRNGGKAGKGKGKHGPSSRIIAPVDTWTTDPWTTDPWRGPDILMAGGTTNAPGKKKRNGGKTGKGKGKNGPSSRIIAPVDTWTTDPWTTDPSTTDPWRGPDILMAGGTTNAPGKKKRNGGKAGKGRGKKGPSSRIIEPIDPWTTDPWTTDPWTTDPWRGPDILMAGGTTNAPGKKKRNGGKAGNGKGKNGPSSRIIAPMDPWTTDPWTGPDIMLAGGTTNSPGKKKRNGGKAGKGKGKKGPSSRIVAPMDPWTTDPWAGPDIVWAGGSTNSPGKKKRNGGKSGNGKGKNGP